MNRAVYVEKRPRELIRHTFSTAVVLRSSSRAIENGDLGGKCTGIAFNAANVHSCVAGRHAARQIQVEPNWAPAQQQQHTIVNDNATNDPLASIKAPQSP
jgi:hypothetical protein